ncbi:MAG: glycosyltransferase family 2 protein [Anaerocolumna sp.]
MENPLVSVIIPTFNNATYIKTAIESVLIQDIDIEIIVVNDCSTDDTDRIVEQYLKYPFFKYIKSTYNEGVAVSRNKGIDIAKGKYIAYLDADDWWVENKLKKQIELLESASAVLCYTARYIISDNGFDIIGIIKVPNVINYRKLLYHNCISCSSVVILTEVARHYKMRCDYCHEDFLNWLTILKKYNLAYGINEPLLMYRMSKNGKSRNKFKSAKMTFDVYRNIGCSKFRSCYFTLSHLIHGLIKYNIY